MIVPALPDSPRETPPPGLNYVGAGQPTGEPNNPFAATTSPPKKPSNLTNKATTPRNRDTRLPSAKTGSVFDRLYKTQTAASKAWTPVRAEARRGGNYSTPKTNSSSKSRRTPPSGRSNASSVDESAQIFQRLHITGTVANASKRLTPGKPPVKFSASKTKGMRSPTRVIPSTHTPLKGNKKVKPGYVYSPRMKPLTTLYFDSRYHPGIGKEVVDPIKLGYTFFQMLCEYENGGLTSEQIAREIIIAFFKKDFPFGRHWELHEPTVDPRPGEEHAYNVKMCATYDWEDAFRIASAQGVVRCNPEEKEVCVLNYIYDVTSDL